MTQQQQDRLNKMAALINSRESTTVYQIMKLMNLDRNCVQVSTKRLCDEGIVSFRMHGIGNGNKKYFFPKNANRSTEIVYINESWREPVGLMIDRMTDQVAA